jgi:diguanylate cyclase (GGDEF)-like protein
MGERLDQSAALGTEVVGSAQSRAPAMSTRLSRRPPITFATILFIVLVCVMLVGMHAWNSWNARQVELHKAETDTRNMAWALAGQVENSIKMVDTVLVGMVERAETDGSPAASATRLRYMIHTHLNELTLLQGLFILDNTGRVIMSSVDGAVSRNNSDREYFQYHKTHVDRGPRVGAPLIGRTSKLWIIPVTRRIDHPDGSFAGVALATIKIDFFSTFYRSVDVGEAGTILLMMTNGTLVLRTPFDPSHIGTDVSSGQISRLLTTHGPVGTAMFHSRIDGIERLYSYRRLNNYPLLVAVARSKEELLAEWRATTSYLTIGLLLLIAGLLTLGARLVRQIVLRDRFERELREAKAALEKSNASLTSLAFSDPLTGLSNRRHFEKALGREFRYARRSGQALALVMLDADNFKDYNDLYGHPAGDHCLRTIGKAIESGLRRPGDVASRYGGEEFAVLLPDTDVEGARAVAEAIRAAVQDAMLEHRRNAAGVVTVSAGVCVIAPHASDTDPLKLVQEADRALYIAKSQGRNRVGVV